MASVQVLHYCFAKNLTVAAFRAQLPAVITTTDAVVYVPPAVPHENCGRDRRDVGEMARGHELWLIVSVRGPNDVPFLANVLHCAGPDQPSSPDQ